jgi:hypothetical protein
MKLPRIILELWPITADEPTRYRIDMIYVHAWDESHMRAVATDGRRLVFVQWETKGAKRFRQGGVFVHRTFARKALSIISQSEAPIIEITGGQLVVQTAKDAAPIACGAVRTVLNFPMYPSAVPAYGVDGVSIAVDAELLHGLTDIVAAHAVETDENVACKAVLTVPHDSARPITIEHERDDGMKIVAVQMPVAVPDATGVNDA